MARSGKPLPPDAEGILDPDSEDAVDLLADTTLSQRYHVWNKPEQPSQPSTLARQLKRARARSRTTTAAGPTEETPRPRRPRARSSGRAKWRCARCSARGGAN
jgi:hypothetical protein